MPKIYIPAHQMVISLGLTNAGEFPQMAQADEDQSIFFLFAKPDNWDGDPMSLTIYGGASVEPAEGANITVRSGLGGYGYDIQTGNAQVVALSTIAQEGYKVVAPVTIEPIGGGDLLRIDIAYFSESYGGRLIVAGATLTYSIV